MPENSEFVFTGPAVTYNCVAYSNAAVEDESLPVGDEVEEAELSCGYDPYEYPSTDEWYAEQDARGVQRLKTVCMVLVALFSLVFGLLVR